MGRYNGYGQVQAGQVKTEKGRLGQIREDRSMCAAGVGERSEGCGMEGAAHVKQSP
jgi:hypothetical protein